MRQRYIAWNGAVPTTGPQLPITVTTNATKTHLQLTAPSTGQLEIVEWGVSFNGSALASGLTAELLATGTVAGTGMTAVTPSLFGDPNAPASNATAGWGPTAEGSITTTRVFDAQELQDLDKYYKQFPLGERPIIPVSGVVRVRITSPSGGPTPGCFAYILWAE
jgi:hypothetical protein